MDNAGDWIYIVFLIIAGVSGLLSSGKKKRQSKEILGQPGTDIPEDTEAPQEKGFWEILQEMQKEKTQPATPSQPRMKSKDKPIAKKDYYQPVKSPTPTPFLSGEKDIPKSAASTLQPEDENNLVSDHTFSDITELRKAIIYTEILNRKY